MAKIRYAKAPPCCPCLDKANDAVWDADQHVVETQFKKKYARNEKIPDDDYGARKYWMDAYVECIKNRGLDPADYIVYDPGLKGSNLRQYCGEKKEERKAKGNLIVLVKDRAGIGLKEANVHITDLLIHKVTNGQGIAKIENLEEKSYPVTAWKDDYSEEITRSPVVRPAPPDTKCEIILETEPPGDLPVLVLDQDNKPVRDATVSAEPVYKTHGSNKIKQAQTDPGGLATFDKMRYNTYKVSAVKDGSVSDTKTGKVPKPWKDYRVTLKIDLRVKLCKDFQIWVDRASWVSGDVEVVSGIRALVVFVIKDMETGRTAKYETKPTLVGPGASFPSLPGVSGGGYTTSEGAPTPFQVPRYVGNKVMDETMFSGDIEIKMGKLKVIVELIETYFRVVFKSIRDCRSKGNVTVDKIKLGAPKDPPSIIEGVTLYGKAKLTRKQGL